jgi:hypothetical protein
MGETVAKALRWSYELFGGRIEAKIKTQLTRQCCPIKDNLSSIGRGR